MFIGGNQHQRPALLQAGNYIYAGYASHCVLYNFTGAIIGFNKNTGAIVEVYAMEGGPEPNTVRGGGVWMSGGGISFDNAGSMFFATGNGYAGQLPATGSPVQGRYPPTALEEAAVKATINSDGTITVMDFFMPWEKTQLDGADKDLGTSPLEILPSNVFSCPNHRRIGVVTGKSGKTYWLNLDDLGGYQMGPNRLDNVIQVYQNENSVYAGAGVMPLGGGYIYINVIQFKTHVFKFSCNAAGNAVFTYVADTPEKNAYVLGVGHGTTTSLNGQEGTGLLWTSDVEGLNLRIYNAIPPNGGGNLTLINAFNVPGVTKFSRPVFGDGRVYLGTTQGYIYGFGSPVNLPLNCSSPYTFGRTAVGSTSEPVTVTCKANVGTTVTALTLAGNANFNISALPVLPMTLAVGQAFSFMARFSPRSVGPLSSDVIVNTTNGISGYSTNTPISLKGTANSLAPLLSINPNTMSFNVIAGQAAASQSVILSNLGDSQLNFINISYSLTSSSGPWATPNTTSDGRIQVGSFKFAGVPSSILANSISTIDITYAPSSPGNDAVYVKGFSNGGNSILDVVGVAGTYPVAKFEFEKFDGSGWAPFTPGRPFSFGDVTENTNKKLKFRITNNGSISAIPLSITVSKPPYGVVGIVGAVNNIDLAEGASIPAGQSQTAVLYCNPPNSQVNLPSYVGNASWTFNTGDPNLGKQAINFTCNAVTDQVGPLFANGTAKYGYIGCFKENNPGRQLALSSYADSNNTNGRCITSCAAQGFRFAATQYLQECWCGNGLPLQKDNDNDCNYLCSGDGDQTCGGNGYFHDQAHMSLFADSTQFDGNLSTPPLAMVQKYGNYNYIGCYSESGQKTFNAKLTASNSMTVEMCGAFCQASSYSLFGLQFANEW